MFFSKTTNFIISQILTLRKGRVLCLGFFSQMNNESRSPDSGLQSSSYQSKPQSEISLISESDTVTVMDVKSEPGLSSNMAALQDKGNGLLLYLNNYSFYAQKVVMALLEKRLSFKTHIVNIAKGEQYQPRFLEVNPRGEVPVLKDGVKVIPDSARIIDYLEDNFSNGNTRLIPLDQGAEIRQKVIYFRNLIDPIPANVITIGSFFHPKFVGKPKPPFIAPVRKALAAAEEKNVANLRSLAEKHPNIKSILLEKADVQQKKNHLITDEAAFEKLLDQVDSVLKEVEKELSSRNESDEKWLCSDRFTVADISLTILLDRLYLLGLEQRFWTDGKKPGITNYYERVRQRDSYKQTVPSQLTHIKTFLEMQSCAVIGTVLVTACALISGGLLFFKKK